MKGYGKIYKFIPGKNFLLLMVDLIQGVKIYNAQYYLNQALEIKQERGHF
jgi:hypothetical protein